MDKQITSTLLAHETAMSLAFVFYVKLCEIHMKFCNKCD